MSSRNHDMDFNDDVLGVRDQLLDFCDEVEGTEDRDRRRNRHHHHEDDEVSPSWTRDCACFRDINYRCICTRDHHHR